MLSALEGLLFIIGDEGLTLKDISSILEINEDETKKLIKELYNELNQDTRGIELEYFGERFNLHQIQLYKEILFSLKQIGILRALICLRPLKS